MLTLIASAMLKSLTSFLFGSYLKAHYGSIEIDGAPSWYATEPKEAICTSTYSNGGIEKLEITKQNSKIKLRKKVKHILEIVVYKNFTNLNPDEKIFLDKITNDKQLPIFVDANLRFQNIKVDKSKHKVFVRSCLDKNGLIKYEKSRIEELKKELVLYKEDKAINELENKKYNKSGIVDKEFEELEKSK